MTAKKAKTTQERTKTKTKTEETEGEEEAEEDTKGALSPRLAHVEPNEPGGGTVAKGEERSSSAVVIGLALAALIALLAIASLGVLG